MSISSCWIHSGALSRAIWFRSLCMLLFAYNRQAPSQLGLYIFTFQEIIVKDEADLGSVAASPSCAHSGSFTIDIYVQEVGTDHLRRLDPL